MTELHKNGVNIRTGREIAGQKSKKNILRNWTAVTRCVLGHQQGRKKGRAR